MLTPRSIVVLAALAALAGCQAANNGPAPYNGPTYTVHGTITATGVGTGDSVITVIQGGNSYSSSVPVAASTSWTYSVPGVPAGDYSASISHPMAIGSSGFGGSYFLDGNPTGYSASVLEAVGTVTYTTGSITVGADLQLDVNTGVG